jgi:hypothetical protein
MSKVKKKANKPKNKLLIFDEQEWELLVRAKTTALKALSMVLVFSVGFFSGYKLWKIFGVWVVYI